MQSTIKNKLISVLLTLSIVCALLPAFPLAASAAATDDNPFSDVVESDWYYDAVQYVYNRDLMTGVSDGTFGPDTELSRAMIVTILYRHAGEPDTTDLDKPFSDVADDAWYADPMKWAYANGVAAGYGDDRFGPDDPVTKEQLAAFIFKAQQSSGKMPMDILMDYEWADWDTISDWAKGTVTKLTMQALFRDIPGIAFRPQALATRAEIAAILYRYLKAVE